MNDLTLNFPIEPILAQADSLLKQFDEQSMGIFEDAHQEIVVNDKDAARVVEKVKVAADLYDELEALRKTYSGPLDKAKKAIDAMFKPAKERLNASKLVMKDQLFSYDSLMKEQARLKEAELRAAQREMGLSEDAVVTTDKTKGLSTRYRNVLVVNDANLIPNSYWMLDEAKVVADLEAGIEVPGCALDKQAIVVVRRSSK